MSGTIKIAVIGDYNFTYYSHQATNLAIDHACNFLELDISYYWIKISEAITMKPHQWSQYDGIWIAPGPHENSFFLHGIVDSVIRSNIPAILTGESFKTYIEVLVNHNNLNAYNEKLISDNLVSGEQFEKVDIVPVSMEMKRLYENHSTVELTSSRYSIYPQLIDALKNDIIDIEAVNQFEEPEIITSKHAKFLIACGFCPQISSTRELPHPLVYTFFKACQGLSVKIAN